MNSYILIFDEDLVKREELDRHLEEMDSIVDFISELRGSCFLLSEGTPQQIFESLTERMESLKHGNSLIVDATGSTKWGYLSSDAWSLLEINEEYVKQDIRREVTPISQSKPASGRYVKSRKLPENYSVEAELAKYEEGPLDLKNTTGSARSWWLAFREENSHRLRLVLKVARELVARKVSITEFFLAYVYSNTDNIQANLYYLDYTRLKKEEEKRKKEIAAKTKATVSVQSPRTESGSLE